VTYAGGEAGQVYRIEANGTYRQIASTGGFLLGLCLDVRCNIYACDIAKKAVMRVTADGEVSVYSAGTRERPMDHPNYAAFDANGNLYVTDSGHWQQDDSRLYRVRPGGITELVSERVTRFANGCCLDPGDRYLYVVMSLLPGVVRLAIRPDGTLDDPEPVVVLPGTVPDGVAFDVAANLYISCYAPDVIYRMAPSGEVAVLASDAMRVTLASPTNITFSGPDRQSLVVASLARWHLATTRMPQAGLPLHHPAL
jgi:gluconolactonase